MPRIHVVIISKVASGEEQGVAERVGLGTCAIDGGEVFSVGLESVHDSERPLPVVLRRFTINMPATSVCAVGALYVL